MSQREVYYKSIRLSTFSAILSLANLISFNIPFLKYAADNVNQSFGGIATVVGLAVLTFTLNYFAAYLILRPLKVVGKVLIAIIHFISTICVYFVIVYKTMMDESMIGNVFNTQYSEASGFINYKIIIVAIIVGLIPAILIVRQRVEYGSWKRYGVNCGISLGASLLIVFLNAGNVLWLGTHDTELGGLTMPWSYTVNTYRHFHIMQSDNQQEILLPDASFADNTKTAVVLVIGESARKANFSLYGYERETNPLLSTVDDLTIIQARSCATFTTAGVKAILEHKESDVLYEILPNYLFRAGADVVWRTSNWGEPPVHIDEYEDDTTLKKRYDCNDNDYDGVLLEGLKDRIESSPKEKVLIILHTSTSHGPNYSKRYPARFEVFSPVNDKVEGAAKDNTALVNAYDNTIVYTDYLLKSIIDMLGTLDGWKSTMIYISDHGESLGEGNLFMHGVPMKIAPAEQYEIPLLVWTSDNLKCRNFDNWIDQHWIFHSILRLMSVNSEVYDYEKDIFE